MYLRLLKYFRAALVATTFASSLLCAGHAQNFSSSFLAPPTGASMYYTPPPTNKYIGEPKVSRLDLYGGYGYFHPVNSDIDNFQYLPINPGAVASVAGYINPYIGLQVEGTFFPSGPDDCVYTAQAGPIVRYQHKRIVPFAHALAGGAKVGGPAFQPCTWGWGVTGGIGVDYILPGFGDHVAIRPIQADFHYSQVDYGPLVQPADVSGGFGEIHAYTLSAGLVLRFGDMKPPPPITLTCSVQPDTVYPGDPVTANVVVTNQNPKKPVTYSWTSDGGRVSGTSETAAVATAGMAPGSYSVKVHVSQGTKPGQMADCAAALTVRASEPPTLTCSANPSSVVSGDPSTITSVGVSPQNRPLTYSYFSDLGQISGTGTSVTLGTGGVPPGTVHVTCNAVDDLGKQATAATTVEVTAPAPPAIPLPQPQTLCSLSFERDHKRPNRVDNESKACLDDIALALQRDSTSMLVIVGNHAPGENADDSAQRGMNVRQYLVDEKGIDPVRIEVRTGDAGTRSVDNVLLPQGANYSGSGTAVDPGSVHRRGQPYGKPHAPRRK